MFTARREFTMPIRYYKRPIRRSVMIKPWALPRIKEMAREDSVPMVKIVTDAVMNAYKQRQTEDRRKCG